MKKKIICTGVAFLLTGVASQAMAEKLIQGLGQVNPMLSEGVRELGVSGNLDFDGPDGNLVLDLSATYGYLIRQYTEVGVTASYLRQNDGDFEKFGLGGFGEIHFPNMLAGMRYAIPYAGVGLRFDYTDIDTAEDNEALVLSPRIGVKWFLRDYFAVDTNLFVDWATDDIYVNDNEADDTDWGIKAGLRVYF